MASVSLFSVGKTLLEKLGPLIQQEVSLLWNLGTELEKLNGTVTAIQALLLDAEEQQEHNHQVKDWLDKLTVILFDAEDLLDDVNVIVQKILESATKQKQQDLELDTLIYLLDGVISRKKYVLVLDDVWNFDHEKWDVLRSVLNRGSSGSKILITTRFENYAKTMSRGCHPPYTLSGISSPQSWSLFSQIVFGVGDHRLGDEKQQTILNVEEIKTEIMKKSAGVPIAVKTLANILYSIESQTEWLPFLRSHKLLGAEHEGSILHNLKLSYDYLPSHLKHCFLHCCLYPKDHEINVESLINEWSALGFIKSSPEDSQQSLVDLGRKCLMDLAWRSFFQEIKRDLDDTVVSCKMHDLIHDLAVSVAGYGYKHITSPTDRVSEKTHHILLSHNLWSPSDLIGHMDKAKQLRSFGNLTMEWFQTGTNWDDSTFRSFVLRFPSLRHLTFGNSGMEMVPHHIQKLKHLRFLDLSLSVKLTRLPNSITKLQHLQILGLHGCERLQELPRDIHKLVNLWYLSCSDCFALSCMPRGLGELTRLEVLTCFVVGKDSSASKHICGLDELNKLNNLRGQFRIVNLRYLREEMRLSPPSLAFEIGMAANLKGKLSLEALLLYWDDGSGETELAECLQESEEDVEWDEHLLESLEPHSNVKGLIVNGYKGGRSPSWISSLTNLVTLQLAYCKVRHGLHHLQVLPTLRRLYLVNLIELDYMDEDEHGDCWGMNEAALNKESEPFFSSLQYLRLECCPKLKGWRRKPPQFPKLSKLFTFGCPLLTSMPLFPTLDKKLSFIDTSLQPLLCTMNYMSSSSSCLSQYPLSNLKKLYIESIHHPPREWLQGMQHLTALQRIEIEGCSGLEETLNWNNITHVPNIIIDGYYINRDGESLWDEDEWCNFPWILELIFVSPDTLYECFLQKIRSAMNEARVSLLGHSCRDAFKQGSGSNTSRDVSGWIATFAAEENGVHSRGESCWKLLHVDLGEYIRPLSGYENIASQSSVALPFSMLDSGVVAKIGPDDLNSEEELFISPEMKNKEQVIPSQSRSYIQWNDAMDDVLTQVLLDQANQGNKADGDWKVQAYQAVVDQVRITLGNILNKDNVKNRLRQWKKQYAVIIDIQNRSGVNLWDEEKKKVVVTTENASDWQNYLKVNPSARSYANKEVKNWDNIVLLCGKDRATGSHVENVQDVVGAMAREEDDTRSNSSFESVGVEGTKGKRSGESSSNSSKRSKKDQVGDSLMMVANTLQSYYESKKKKEESRHSTKEIYEVLCNIPGLSRTEIAKAVIKYNNSDPGQFNLLLDIPCEERKLFVECFLSES
ncbi:Putative disease resistance protein RGA1 [Linum perenne]